jgi:hypothetical protein
MSSTQIMEKFSGMAETFEARLHDSDPAGAMQVFSSLSTNEVIYLTTLIHGRGECELDRFTDFLLGTLWAANQGTEDIDLDLESLEDEEEETGDRYFATPAAPVELEPGAPTRLAIHASLFEDLSMAKAVEKLLKFKQAPMRTQELAAVLRELKVGPCTRSKTYYNNLVWTSANRCKNVRKVRPGVWQYGTPRPQR